jgi:hypothetical protein
MKPLISWDAPEHHYTEKNNDWYWAVGIITLTAAALAFIFGNIIFGILIIVGVFALVVHAARKPDLIQIEVNDRGILVEDVLYPFLTIESFWIDAHEHPPRLLLKSTKMFMPYIVIHIQGIDREKVREVLLTYVAETEHREPLTQKLLEKLGF